MKHPVAGTLDPRVGVNPKISASLSYETEKTLGKWEGLDWVVFYDKVPFLEVRETWSIIISASGWDSVNAAAEASARKYAEDGFGEYIENVSPGDKFYMNNELYYSGTYSLLRTYAQPADVSGVLREMTMPGWDLPVGGYYEGSSLKGKLYFTQAAFGKKQTITYTASQPQHSIGNAGNQIVSAVNSSNPRYVGPSKTLLYDYSVTINDNSGTRV